MPITESQLAERHKYIGASDIADIMGEGAKKEDGTPWRTPYDVWLEKTGRLIPKEKSSTEANLGNELEPYVLNMASKTLGRIKRSDAKGRALEYVKTIEGVLYIVHPDAILLEKNSNPLDAKTSGLTRPNKNEVWLDPKEQKDGCPNRVILQSYGQMMVMEKDFGYIAALLTWHRFHLYEVEFRTDIYRAIIEGVTDFVVNHVQKDIPPTDCLPSTEIVKRIRRQPNKTISIPKGLIAAYQEAHQFTKEADSRKEQAKNAILAALDGAEKGVEEETGLIVTNFMQQRKEVVIPACEFPVMRFPKK